MIKLENNRIKLRAFEPEDIELLYRWENDIEVWKVSNTIFPLSRYLLKKYISISHEDIFSTHQLRLMIDEKQSGKPVGTIEIFDFEPLHLRAGIGIIVVDKQLRNQGLATEALQLMISYSFKTLHLHQLYCNIDKDNEISIKLFTKSGFVLSGEKRDWNRTAETWKTELFFQLINSD